MSAGLNAALGLGVLPQTFGNWSLTAGVDLLIRDEQIVEAGPAQDEANNTVVIGTLSASFFY